MKLRSAPFVVVAALAIAACSSDTSNSIETDLRTAVSDVSSAVDDAVDNAGEVVARNIATQQGEEQFKNAGHELDGPLTCDATVADGVSQIDISCTGTTKAGGEAVLSGATDEIPGASVVSLGGSFTGTVDGTEVFTTGQLGG